MAVTMTEAAVKRVRVLCKKRQTPDAVLRVGVRGGGCSGLSYFMDFVEEAEEKDKLFLKRVQRPRVHPPAPPDK